MSWESDLFDRIKKTRIALIRFSDDEWEDIGETHLGHSEFTFVRPHRVVEDIKVPMPCLVIGGDDFTAGIFIGLLTSKASVATLESRVKVRRCVKLPLSQPELLALLPQGRTRNAATERLGRLTRVLPLPPIASQTLARELANDERTRGAVRIVADGLQVPKKYTSKAALQIDGIRTALKAFGLSPHAAADQLEITDEETALGTVNLLEDAVIEHDARQVPGFALIGSEPTGRARFSKHGSTLQIFTANKKPLEELFGVDLIYFNETLHSIVMLQYKMLERSSASEGRAGDDWIYRPDSQLDKELARMEPFRSHDDGDSAYRLSSDPFYMKFVRRNTNIGQAAILTTVEHFQRIRLDPKSKGKKGGIRISFDLLRGNYLHEHGFMDLLHSGYIGSRGATTDNFRTLIDLVLQNNRGVVAAIQNSDEAQPGAPLHDSPIFDADSDPDW